MTNEDWIIINTSVVLKNEPISAVFVYICKGLAKSYRIENVIEVSNFVSTGSGEIVFIDYARENYGIEVEHWKWNNTSSGRIIGSGFKFKKNEALTTLMLQQPWTVK